MKIIIMPICICISNIFFYNLNNLLLVKSIKKNKNIYSNTLRRKNINLYLSQNIHSYSYIRKTTFPILYKNKKTYTNKYHTSSSLKLEKTQNQINPSNQEKGNIFSVKNNKMSTLNFDDNNLEIQKKHFVIQENPDFIKYRLDKFNELKEKKKKILEKIIENDPNYYKEINIELLDGSIKIGQKNVTTPYQIASQISKKLSENSIVAKVIYLDNINLNLCDIENDHFEEKDNDKSQAGILWDMNVPLIGNCKIKFLGIETIEGKKVFWHSSAHILGSSLEKLYGGYLTIGPALSEGFYYDIYLGNNSILSENYNKIENEYNKLVKENVEFEKMVCTKEEVLELFKYNPFKIELIKSKIRNDNEKTSVYKCGDFIDLCLGPHIKNTGKVKAFKVLKNSSAYWLGNKNNDSLQRVYGISFQKKTELTDYIKFIEEAKKRDHRNVGKNLNLFFFEKETSPGSGFWFAHGAKIYNKLIEFMRKEYRIRKYEEVITPNIFSCDLWKTSGHYQNYKNCMFIFNIENKEWGMKPMNCPGHCLIFKQLNASYKSLPIRLADFGVLHRNEITGSLSGLTRVRRFQQDDAHIFCSLDHIKTEVVNVLQFIFFVYNLFGFKYDLYLSTRPPKYIGDIDTWNFAEKSLKEALELANVEWKLNEGDGAFYGPKIDIVLKDSLNRSHQCGTVQLDFQLPIRFNLQYKNKEYGVGQETDSNLVNDSNIDPIEKKEDSTLENIDNNEDAINSQSTAILKKGFDRPIIIHRAILGSVERFVAILVEHTSGKFPFWLSPRQAIVLPISDKFNEYAKYIHNVLTNNLFDVDVDISVNTLNKKIREAQLKQYNFILVVGEKEISTNTVTVRDRDNPNDQKVYTIQELVNTFKKMLDINSIKLNEITPFIQQ
ncbi:threonine--tRNA ligase, putative [Plasmodium berghei]|uniref:threonine--tRNA ligase n=2 Tax=Plasmodium berghei TaxID=5821 RepID=A0A509AIA0_PLABA|nr:threonine--tRNA ligase, putative [Plasmodium berghei ANKA]CXI42996.1 threonine--tRNA ligase, putative [Plasmodium berghei]SCM22229.1 threonine--tRNA ligase, putative [Plasmodium berghei]SCN25344.1 threonine--tRNA ligase, putative [Plasmodium berghei]SCO60317.1 threonine--tRNA ligase, putative [Plasmodium berghei]SCO62022.1 threonine--tRNA ligase, putative [Plasmodium berghei]|eukprot:XP_034421573.1 threonine--tRNA ligase, putative [Plasmodium berghei ANKA]